jgi:hypothetical protein
MATIQVSAATVRKYYNNPSVCGSWKDAIRETFDLYSTQDEFQVDDSFFKDMYAETGSSDLRAEISNDFPSVTASESSDSDLNLAQTFQLAPVAIMAGVEVAGNSAKNSKLPEAEGRGIFLDGNYEFLIRKTKKGNYLIVPVQDNGADAPTKFVKLSSLF